MLGGDWAGRCGLNLLACVYTVSFLGPGHSSLVCVNVEVAVPGSPLSLINLMVSVDVKLNRHDKAH